MINKLFDHSLYIVSVCTIMSVSNGNCSHKLVSLLVALIEYRNTSIRANGMVVLGALSELANDSLLLTYSEMRRLNKMLQTVELPLNPQICETLFRFLEPIINRTKDNDQLNNIASWYRSGYYLERVITYANGNIVISITMIDSHIRELAGLPGKTRNDLAKMRDNIAQKMLNISDTYNDNYTIFYRSIKRTGVKPEDLLEPLEVQYLREWTKYHKNMVF
jgi:hypothetical protein